MGVHIEYDSTRKLYEKVHYILFYEYDGETYRPTYVLRCRDISRDLSIWFDHFDLTGDGRDELILNLLNGEIAIITFEDDEFKIWYYHKLPQPYGISAVSQYENFGMIISVRNDNTREYNSIHFETNFIYTPLKEETVQPRSPVLLQNYPNPFNPSTTIEFDLPKTSEVILKIYNLLGEEIATLLSASLLSGSHSVNWDASNLASGVYLYRLQAGDYIETKKLILMK